MKVKIKKRKHKSSKGRLIKGMTKKLPYEILNDPAFTKKLKELMKGNKVRGRVPIDSDLNRVLREILMERGKEYKKLRAVFDHQ